MRCLESIAFYKVMKRYVHLSIFDDLWTIIHRGFSECYTLENPHIFVHSCPFFFSIAVNNIGETVTSEQQVATIVPAGTPIEMVCYVKNMDIADIKDGQVYYSQLT